MRLNPKNWTALTTAVFAAAIIFGCGGGGGGGKTSTTTSSTSTTSSSTTATATGTIFSSNEIVYGLPNDPVNPTTFNVAQVKPDGTGNSALLSGIPTTVSLFGQIPGSSQQFVFAAALGATSAQNYGIYKSKNLSTTTVTGLVGPTYSSVNSLSVTANGTYVVYTATLPASVDPTGTSNLYVLPVKGGTPVNYGPCDGATVSPADSNTIVYVALSAASGVDQVFSRSLSAGASGATTQLTNDAVNHILPAINRTGTQIAYWEQGSTATSLLIQTLSGNTTVTLPNPSSLTPFGESFSADGTEVGIAADSSGAGQILTQPVAGGASPTTILSNSSVELGLYGIYWTDVNGRGLSGSIMNSAVRPKTGLPYFLHR